MCFFTSVRGDFVVVLCLVRFFWGLKHFSILDARTPLGDDANFHDLWPQDIDPLIYCGFSTFHDWREFFFLLSDTLLDCPIQKKQKKNPFSIIFSRRPLAVTASLFSRFAFPSFFISMCSHLIIGLSQDRFQIDALMVRSAVDMESRWVTFALEPDAAAGNGCGMNRADWLRDPPTDWWLID